MPKKPSSGGKRPSRPTKDPFPILVPKGNKQPSGTRVGRWVRDVLPTPSSDSDGASAKPEKAPPTKPRRPPQPVQRSTIQMLPGRLQPINTSVIQQEVRFVRVPSEEQVVTLGWNLGEPPEHVTLNHSSIQPLHARMTYRDNQWWMESLDRNDPVVINSAVLRPEAPPRPLADGDHIRIGAALFRFFFP